MIEAVAPRGLILDLQVIRPDPYVELDGEVIARIDGEPLFTWADAATAAVDARIAAGDLAEEAVDDHEALLHYPSAGDLVDDIAESMMSLPAASVPSVRAVAGPLVVHERCRLRRLRCSGTEPASAGHTRA